MMNLQRLLTEPSPLVRSAILATGVVGLLAASGPEGIQSTGAAPHKGLSASSHSAENQSAERSQLASLPNEYPGQNDGAMAELAGAVAEAFIALDKPLPVVESASINPPDVTPMQPAAVQVASVDPSDIGVGDPNRVINSIAIIGECLVVEVCIDQYLWALYQRAPKEDTIKVRERRDVLVKRKRKTVTVVRTFTKLVDQDFGWKDPKAAERVRMSMMDYVIGGMDRSFKLKLFRMLRAAEAAGLSPGITSAFRDDYRQSIASGLKAASNKSFHGGSSRGGYGHGLAADIVSVQGGTRDQRWASSDRLWKWVDAHGKEFGIGRPYLGRDPPHVAPIDGQEYAAHNRGTRQAASDVRKAATKKAEVKKLDVKKLKRVTTRDYSRPAKRPRTAAASKLKAS